MLGSRLTSSVSITSPFSFCHVTAVDDDTYFVLPWLLVGSSTAVTPPSSLRHASCAETPRPPAGAGGGAIIALNAACALPAWVLRRSAAAWPTRAMPACSA